MYLRTTQRRRTDGSLVRYVQLAHNRRINGVTQAEVLLNLGREELARHGGAAPPGCSRSRASPTATAAGCRCRARRASSSVVGSRPLGGVWLLDGLWRAAGGRSCACRCARPAALHHRRRAGAVRAGLLTARSIRARSSPRRSGPAATCTSRALRRWTRTRPTGRWTCWSRPTARRRCRRRCSSPAPICLNLEVDLLFFDTTSDLLRARRARAAARARSASSAIARTTAPTCRRS